MRKAATVQKVPFLAPDVVTKVIPAPTDGWDAISPLAEMDPKRAPILINWVPRPGFVELRGGYFQYSSLGITNPVETLMVYRSETTEKFYAACDGHIYDVSISTPSSVVAGNSSDRFQYVNFTNAAQGHVIQAVNGVDQLWQFDGASWTQPSITGLPGGTTAGIVNIWAAKQRLWYMFNQSTVVAYMPTGANIGPIAGTQDLGTLWNKGGYLVAMQSWTVDGGSGPQDYVMFMSSRGQVSIYAGTDPTNASAWQLVGTFDVSPPIGRRCMTRVGSDVAIITQGGVIPISQALPFDPSADRSVAITARIQNAMNIATQMYGTNFGWQFIAFPFQTLAVLNVPQIENQTQVQFVMNTLTGAWCQFNGWNSNCYEIYKDNLYWGDNNGHVNQGYIGSSDNGVTINADMQCAFNWLDEPGKVKRMTMIQPLLLLGGSITPTIAIDVDFTASNFAAPVSTILTGVAWDIAVWDVSSWSLLAGSYNRWLSVEALGHALAVRMKVNVSNPAGLSDPTLPLLQVNAFNTINEMGGAI